VEDSIGRDDGDDNDYEEDKPERETIARETSLLPWLTNKEFIQSVACLAILAKES